MGIDSKLFIDIAGATFETTMLAYFYTKILGKSTVSKNMQIMIYLITAVMTFIIATYVEESKMRTLCCFICAVLPLVIYQEKITIKIIFAVIFVTIQATVEMLAKAILLSIQGDVMAFTNRYLENYLLGVMLSKILALFLVNIVVSIYQVYSSQMPFKLFCILLMMPLATLFAIYQLIEANYVLNTSDDYLKMALTTFLLVGANIALFYLFNKVLEMEHLKTKIALGEIQLDSQEQFYGQIVHQQKEVRGLYHDMKNQLAVISGYLADQEYQEARTYIQGLEVSMAEKYVPITGYSALDIILSNKLEEAQKKEIQFNYQISLQQGLKLEQKDLVIILANGLDNALEATAAIEDSSQRKIQVTMTHDEIYWYLTIENTIQQKVVIHKDQEITTTKQDKLRHGLGLGNVKRLVEKYDGVLQLESDAHHFTFYAMVKINKAVK